MTPWSARVAGPMRCSPQAAQPYRASMGVGHSRVLKRELSLQVSTMLDVSRFDAAPLIAFIAAKETNYGNETHGRIPR